ncbi:MAG: carboxypeptidase-like regulatory domain-containing protein [Acidobacteriota bacterium]
MKSRITLATLLVTITVCVSVFGQNFRGIVRGQIADSSAKSLTGAKLTLVREETKESRKVTSNSTGGYALTLLPPGDYRIEVEQTGFKKTVSTFRLEVNQELRLDLALQIGTLTDEVKVEAPKSALKKDSSSLGTVIENSQVTGLPLDGRNFLELGLLVPGAAPSAQGSAGTVRGDFAFSVNGGREDSNSYLLDGVYNIDPKLNGIAVRPPVDAIREFEVLSSTYDASFGRNSGAQVNVVLKSGSNGFHGAAYEFLRNRSLDARNYFAPSGVDSPQYQRNQFGFSLGGPIITNRTFFFTDYEGTRLREGLTRVTNVPTLLERKGDFSQSILPKPTVPGTTNPFPLNTIPGFFQNPVGVKLAALYPLPNRSVPLENFVSSPARRDRDDLFDVRIDHHLSSSSQLASRYSFDDRDLFEPFSGATFAAIPGFGTQILRRGQNFTIGETHIFSPRLLNDARFAFNRVALAANQENQARNLNSEVGLPLISTKARDLGLTFTTVPGYSPIGDEFNNPQFSATNTFQVLDTATYAYNKHLIKFGFDIRAFQQNAFRDVQSRGFLAFSPQAFTGNALADLLLGLPVTTGVARLDNPQHLRGESYSVFATDSFRVRANLTLIFGLRYEYNSPAVDVEDRANIFDIASRALVPVGTRGAPRSGYLPDRNNFAPRVGLAWTLGSRGMTVVRGGYGIYYDQSSLAPGEGLYFNSPYFDLRFFFPYPQAGISLSLSDPFPASFPIPTPSSAFAFQRDLRTPYTQHWNLSVQQQLGGSRVAELAYVGSKGSKLLAARDINEPHPGTQPINPRPLPQFSDILLQESSASSTYHSLQARLQQRLDFGLSLLASYTWSKSIDNASSFFVSAGDPNFPQNSYNPGAERGRSNFDLRHRFSVSYSYDLPFGKGKAWLDDNGLLSTIASGWQTMGIVSLQTGRPFTVALLSEIDQSNTGRANLGFGSNDRPNLVGNAKLSNPTPNRWFNTSAFAFQPFGSFGNAGRNILDGPGFQNVNFSILKNTMLKENLNLQLRAEFFNLFNHPNFDLPDNFLGSPTFGRVLSAQSPRHIQFGVKLLF